MDHKYPILQHLHAGHDLSGNSLCPVISTISYIFLENHAGRGMIVLPVLVTLVYGLIMLYLNAKSKYDGPYPFFRVHHQTKKATVLWVIILMVVIGGISAVVSAVAR